MFLKIGIGALGALLMLGTAGALAGSSVPTTNNLVAFADSDEDGSSDYIVGKVTSPNQKCVPGRTVKVFLRPPGGGEFRLVDRAQTSKKGFWAGGGVENINARDGKVTVDREVISRPGGQIVCAADVETFD